MRLVLNSVLVVISTNHAMNARRISICSLGFVMMFVLMMLHMYTKLTVGIVWSTTASSVMMLINVHIVRHLTTTLMGLVMKSALMVISPTLLPILDVS